MFPLDSPDISTCQYEPCQRPRYSNIAQVEEARNNTERDPNMPLPSLKSESTMAYTSIANALTEFYADPIRSDMLDYRNHFFDHSASNNQYRDVFSGAAYQRLLNEGVLEDNTICLLIFVDGYQPKHVQKAHQVMINCLILNIHPEYRYKH